MTTKSGSCGVTNDYRLGCVNLSFLMGTLEYDSEIRESCFSTGIQGPKRWFSEHKLWHVMLDWGCTSSTMFQRSWVHPLGLRVALEYHGLLSPPPLLPPKTNKPTKTKWKNRKTWHLLLNFRVSQWTDGISHMYITFPGLNEMMQF